MSHPGVPERIVSAYAALSPARFVIRATIAQTPDDAWQSLCASVAEPNTLHDRGWRVGRLRCTLEEILGDRR